MKSTRKLTALVMAMLLGSAFGACGSGSHQETTPEVGEDHVVATAEQEPGDEGELPEPEPIAPEDALVGISMPSRDLERWNYDGQYLDELLKEQGFNTELEFADNRIDQQIAQLQTMIDNGANVLVVAAIDGSALGPVLEDAADQGIRILAYDRLINDTTNIDYYATFDNELVGQIQADYIIDRLGLADGRDGPYNIELFAGAPEDNNSRVFFCSAFNELKPYFDDGKLVSPSGKVPESCDEWEDVAVDGWTSDNAQEAMASRLAAYHKGQDDEKRLNAVLSPNDSIALGITNALLAAGYEADHFPVLTGQDADVANVQNIIDGTQSMTVWKDTRELGNQVANMVGQLVSGKPVSVNDTETYDNGAKIVPTYLLPFQLVQRGDIQTKLIDSGFISPDAVHGLDD